VIVGVDGLSRLIDFGVAKASHRLTESESGDIKGKYAYMSPEQVAGLPVDRRSDVFAAVVVLFETLTGVRLFAGEHAMETLRRVVDDPLPDLRAFANVPVELHEVFARGLAKDASQRIASAAALAEAIEARVPTATHRRVGEWVAQHCGALLAERRALLEESRKTGLSRTGDVRALDAASAGQVVQRREDATTHVQPHTPAPGLAPSTAPGTRDVAAYRADTDAATSVASASTSLARGLGPARDGRVLALSVAMGTLLAALVGLTLWAMRERPAPAHANANASAAASSANGTSAASGSRTASPSASVLMIVSPVTTAAGSAGTGTGTSRAAATGEAPAKKTSPARRPAPSPRPDDLQGDPYGSP
jgi:serine/threonine-protein kinase